MKIDVIWDFYELIRTKNIKTKPKEGEIIFKSKKTTKYSMELERDILCCHDDCRFMTPTPIARCPNDVIEELFTKHKQGEK